MMRNYVKFLFPLIILAFVSLCITGCDAREVAFPDSDADGLYDFIEHRLGTDPFNPDTDGDGLLDGEEDINRNGVVDEGETDPNDADTDDDGINDGSEDEYTDESESDGNNDADSEGGEGGL